MMNRSVKEVFYRLAGPLMQINAFFYKSFRSPKPEQQTKVHLGPGQKKYMDGWLNIDANMFTARCDVWADLRHPLPFHESTIDAMYSHHMIEHLPDLASHFKDAFRCIKPGGAYRVGGPDGDNAIKKFIEGDKTWFGDWPDNRRSMGGRFENFIFCRGEHLTILTYSFLEELLSDAGFTNIRQCTPSKQTNRAELFFDCLAVEDETDFVVPHSLMIEAEKPETVH
jgi:predicted SAM-dependent methyltransferase